MNPATHDAIDVLLDDHQRIKALLDELFDDGGGGRARTIDALKAILTLHNATEENVVYPAISKIAQRPMHARTLYHQQDDAQVAFWELAMLDRAAPDFLRKTAEFRDAVFAHIRQEEEHDFPHLREALAPEAAQLLAGEVRAFRDGFAVLR